MKVIPPLTITDAILTDTDVTETHSAYSGGATYAEGDRVLDATGHLVYESLQASNNGHALTEADWWILVGPSNIWAMFDLLSNTPTVQADGLEVELTPGERVNSIALMGMVANTAQVWVHVDAVEVYDSEEIDLNTREVLDWYMYFFEPFSTKSSVVLTDLPPVTDAVITVALTADSGDVECGFCVLGNFEDLGLTQAEVDVDALNFSEVTRDFDGGVSSMVQRRNVPKTVQTIWAEKRRLNRIRAVRDALNGMPAVWSGLDDNADGYFDAVLILGFYRRFSFNLRNPNNPVISLELESI